MDCQPGAGEFPIAFDRNFGDAQFLGDLALLEARKKPQLRNAGGPLIGLLQPGQGFIDDEQIVVGADCAGITDKIQGNFGFAAASAAGRSSTRMIDENAPQSLRGHGEEMSPAAPFGRVPGFQAEIKLVNQCRRLQRMARTFGTQPLSGHAAQLGVEPCEHLTRTFQVPVAPVPKILGNGRSIFRLSCHFAAHDTLNHKFTLISSEGILSEETMIVSEQVGRIREFFEAASESEGAAREALLRRAGEGDPGLRELLEQMLRADSNEHSILDHPLGLPADSPLAEPALKRGDMVGAYRILRKIGDGGMGVVYLAERGSELFAVKMMLGPSPAFTDRFLQERAILTRLHHPNIASFVDSGQTEDKMLYLVMEYVDGRPIHLYCEQKRLSVNRIIELFRQVCAAVTYLHQNLVVHRDLKPNNILVTEDGRAKLVDFGIAKLLPGHQYTTLAAQTAAGAMTPYYASPEQVRGGPTSTLTDVFTLGILLYELLTGINPFSDQNTEVHETLRRICEDDPLKPSAVSGRAQLRGEIDNIVLKAMQKQPPERYASVEQFDADLGSFLAGLPVLAQGSSLHYRVSKFVRRYRASVAVAALLLISLFGGVIATSVQARIASRERLRAEAQAQAAETARTAAEQERNRAEIQKAEAQRERANAERRLAALEKVVVNTVKVYQSTDQTAVSQSTKALMAESVRDSLLTLGGEGELRPGFASLLPSLSAEVRGYQVADATAAWQVPKGWSAHQTKGGEYRVGLDRQFLYQGKPSLFLSSLVPKPDGGVNVAQEFGAAPYRGSRVRLAGFLQTASVATSANLVLTITAGEDRVGRVAAVSGTQPWKKYEIVMDVPDDADHIRIAVGVTGTGTLWAANLSFERVGRQVPLTAPPKAPANPQNLNFTAK